MADGEKKPDGFDLLREHIVKINGVFSRLSAAHTAISSRQYEVSRFGLDRNHHNAPAHLVDSANSMLAEWRKEQVALVRGEYEAAQVAAAQEIEALRGSLQPLVGPAIIALGERARKLLSGDL